MKYKTIIFDLDGVIVPTDEYHYRAWKKLAEELGIAFDRNKDKLFRGVSRENCVELLLENHNTEFSKVKKTEFATLKNNYYKQSLINLTKDSLDDEILKTLLQLKSKNYNIAIGSSSKNAKLILNKIGLLGFFDAISDGTNITKSKPDPEVFQNAADMIGVPYNSCIVVEDAEAGIIGAKNAGMYAIAINDAYGFEEADISIKKLSDLLGILNIN